MFNLIFYHFLRKKPQNELLRCPAALIISLCVCVCVSRPIVIQNSVCLSQWEVRGHHLQPEPHTHSHTLLTSLYCRLYYTEIQWKRETFLSQDESVCARTQCGAGRECVSNDRGEPVCRCLQVKLLKIWFKHLNRQKLALSTKHQYAEVQLNRSGSCELHVTFHCFWYTTDVTAATNN